MEIFQPGRKLELPERVVQVWCVRTYAAEGEVDRFWGTLAPWERDRAKRYRIKHLQDRFIFARAALRVLLGGYLGVRPQTIPFRYGSKGKPTLAEPAFLHFNASHSGDLAVYAFTGGCELGIDVEEIRPVAEMHKIASRFFTPEEAAELISLPLDEQQRAFFRCWTRKEAYLKAVGDGLSVPLDSFEITMEASGSTGFVRIPGEVSAAPLWTVHDLAIVPTYAAALAYRDSPREVVLFPLIEPAQWRLEV